MMRSTLLCIPALLLSAVLPARADGDAAEPVKVPERRSTLEKAGRIGSDALGPFMLVSAAGIGLQEDYRGERMARSAAAIATTGALTEALKRLTHEKRPNGENDKSFPSGHASLSFATATLVDAYQPHYKGLAYATAAGISISRVLVHAHHPHDVLVGAALGHFVTRAFTGKYRGQEESGPPTNVPAAVPVQYFTPAAPDQEGGWRVKLEGGRLSMGISW